MNKLFIEFLGWYGAVAIVLAYTLVSFSVLQSGDLTYQILNLTGAIGIVVVSFYKKAWQPGVLNIVWGIVALIAILKIVL